MIISLDNIESFFTSYLGINAYKFVSLSTLIFISNIVYLVLVPSLYLVNDNQYSPKGIKETKKEIRMKNNLLNLNFIFIFRWKNVDNFLSDNTKKLIEKVLEKNVNYKTNTDKEIINNKSERDQKE